MRTLPSRLAALFGALALLLGWLAADLLARRVSIAAELQYLPPDYSWLVATGSPRRLWAAVDDHFGTLIRTDPFQGAVYSGMRDLQEQLGGYGLEIVSPDDVDRAGVDGTRGMVGAYYPSKHFLVVINASDVGRLARTIAMIQGADADQVPSLSTSPVRVGDQFVANPAGGIVIVSDDEALMKAALATRLENRRHAFGSDRLYEAVSGQWRGPMLTGASLFVSSGAPPHPLIRHLSAVVQFGRDITVDTSVDLEMAPVRVLEAVVAPPPALRAWDEELSQDVAAAVTVRDRAIPLYIDTLSRAGLLTAVEQRYAGVLGELRHLPSLRQITLAVTGYHDGLPDLLFGLWAEPVAVDAMITRVQSRIRLARDQAILTAARAAGQSPLPEPGSFFERYRISNGVIEPITFSASDFANEQYEREVDGQTIRFLLPPVTNNDLMYRSDLHQVPDSAVLTGDRYRLAVSRVGDVYWFASDVGLLEAKLRHQPPHQPLRDLDLFTAARSAWSGGERLQGFANLDRVIEAGLLSPEGRISTAIRRNVLDLREHPGISLGLVTSRGSARARFIIRMSRQ
jgi:hypothetical protein